MGIWGPKLYQDDFAEEIRDNYKEQLKRGKTGEQITKETTPMSLRDKAKSYKMQNALRLSVRYAYIALLYQMHEKNLLYLP